MPLEIGSFINDLTPANPPGSDPAGQGDDHLRLIKTVVQGTLPQMGTVLGRVVSQDVAVSISSIWNTNHFLCTASATTTVVLTLPPAGSITCGFYVDITTLGTGTVSLLPSGSASINGSTSLSIPARNTGRAYFLGGLSWLVDLVPHGQGGYNFSGIVTLATGQLAFPAAQNPSANANTLDDYEEGTWTPVLTFSTPGNISVVYTTQIGSYVKIGGRLFLDYSINTSTFSYTTASGNLRVTGLPFNPPAQLITGTILFSGFDLTAGYTALTPVTVASSAINEFWQQGDTAGAGILTATNEVSGINKLIVVTMNYFTG